MVYFNSKSEFDAWLGGNLNNIKSGTLYIVNRYEPTYAGGSPRPATSFEMYYRTNNINGESICVCGTADINAIPERLPNPSIVRFTATKNGVYKTTEPRYCYIISTVNVPNGVSNDGETTLTPQVEE